MGQYGCETPEQAEKCCIPISARANASHFFSPGRTAAPSAALGQTFGIALGAGEPRGSHRSRCRPQWGEGAAPHPGSLLNRPGARPWEVDDVVTAAKLPYPGKRCGI